jgi:hypothetical protein
MVLRVKKNALVSSSNVKTVLAMEYLIYLSIYKHAAVMQHEDVRADTAIVVFANSLSSLVIKLLKRLVIRRKYLEKIGECSSCAMDLFSGTGGF